MTLSPDRSISRPAAWTEACSRDEPSLAGGGWPSPHVGKEDLMTEATPPVHVSGVPVDSRAGRRLKAGEGGWAEHLAVRMRLFPSLFVSWLVANAGVVVMAAIMVAIGFFVTKVLLSFDAVVTADEWLPIWVEGQRTPFWDDASYVASNLADRYVLIPLIGAALNLPHHSAPLADGQLHPPGGAGGGALLRDRDLLRESSPPARRADGPVQPDAQLPVGARGRVGRDLRRYHAAYRGSLQGHPDAGLRLDLRRPVPDCRPRPHGSTAASTIPPTSSPEH